LINDAITEARHIARGLSPVELEPQGLSVALEQLATNVSNMFDVKCTFTCQQVDSCDNATAVHLYRIAQEAVNNAIKHGHPKHVWVALLFASGRMNLTVEDDGTGIVEEPEQTKGMGLQIMAYRAKLIGGQLDVHRQEGGARLSPVRCKSRPTRIWSEPVMTANQKQPADKRKGARILIVDDHPIVREHLRALIEQQKDLEVCASVSDATEAMNSVASLKPDLAIVDLSLKSTHGLDLIKDLASNYPR